MSKLTSVEEQKQAKTAASRFTHTEILPKSQQRSPLSTGPVNFSQGEYDEDGLDDDDADVDDEDEEGDED